MPERRTLIGVTGPDTHHRLSWNCLRANLKIHSVRMVRVTPGQPHYDTHFDGIIVSGGRDVDPERYGKQRITDYPYDLSRDALEARWIETALQQKIPLLGICRGAQFINVVLGGTLHLDIKLVCETAKYPDTILSKVFARKPVIIAGNSRLHHILRREVVMVNSLHRQAIDEAHPGLVVTAREENGIIQGVEGASADHYLLGVQWHPEFMLNSHRQRRIFMDFVQAARN